MNLFNKIRYLRVKLKSERWINNRLRFLYRCSEQLNTFYQFECSDFFRGYTSASRNRIWHKKRDNQIDRQIKFLERTLKQIKR